MVCGKCGDFVRYSELTGPRCSDCWLGNKRGNWLFTTVVVGLVALTIGLQFGYKIHGGIENGKAENTSRTRQ